MGADLELQAHFRVTDVSLEVQGRISNPGPSKVFVLNGLWNLDSSNRIVPEAAGAYRFVDEGNLLVLLIGIPWLPVSKTPFYQNVPHATAIAPGDHLYIELSLPLPVKEYNPYFPEQEDSRYETLEARSAQLAVHYVVDRPELEPEPSRILEGFQNLPPEALGHVVTLRSARQRLSAPALKRTDEEFERPTKRIVEGS